MKILNSPAAVCFNKRISKHYQPLKVTLREGAYSGNKSEDLPMYFSNLKLSRKELGTQNIKDERRHPLFSPFPLPEKIIR